MPALDLGDADRVLTPPSSAFTSVSFGDVTLEPADSPHPVDMFGDWPRIPRATSAGASLLSSAAEFTPSETFAAFIAVTGPAVGTGTLDVIECAPFGLGLKVGTLAWAYAHGWNVADTVTLPDAHDSGVTVYGIVNNATASFAANSRSGTLSTEADFTGAYSNSVYMYATGETDPDAGVLGVWYFDDVDVSEADMLDTITAIEAMFAAAPGAVHATAEGGWGITAPTATLTVGDPEPFVDIDDLPDAGGELEIPDDPDPDPVSLAAYLVRPMRHVWEHMPPPTIVDGRPVGWVATSHGNAPYGFRQIIINGIDVTVVDGIPTPTPSTADVEPFGFAAAHIDLPSVGIGRATPSWAVSGANVHTRIALVDENWELTGEYVTEYRGIVIEPSTDEGTGWFGLDCIGLLFQGDLQTRRQVAFPSAKDLGGVIASALNGVVGRRFGATAKVITGIKTSTSGGGEPLLTGYIQQRLATALKNGKQLTVTIADKTPAIVWKDRTTIHATVRDGQRGVAVQLSSDASQAPNVIFCEGVNVNGGRWSGWKYPNAHVDDAPLFPLDVSDWFRIGLRDSATTSGRGVSDAQDKLDRPVTRVWNRGDVYALRDMQERARITVDGMLGPQSWAALFDTGANTGSLDGAQRFPLAIAKEVQPYKYGPDGDKLGDNPAYNPAILRVEAHYNLGQGVSKSEARKWAREVLKRDSGPGWAGTITFRNGFSPEQMHATALRAGMNIKVYGHRGADRVLHIASVDRSGDEVRLTVDTRARDYPTLEAILERDRNAIDPAKAAVKRLLKGGVSTDRPEYDAESPAGRMPRHAVNGGLWDVRRIPLGDFGTVAKSSFRTDDPTKFSLAIFGKQVTAEQLLSWVGNPLTAEDNPWENDELDGKGLLQSWGWKDQPAGYYPKSYWTHKGVPANPITGRMYDDASFEFASDQAPYVWVAMFTAADTYAWGRLYGRAGD